MFDLGPLLQAHTTILSSRTSACAQGTIPVGQAEHLSTAHPEALSVSCVRLLSPTASGTAPPEPLSSTPGRGP
jgi:hypothetical protein